MANAFNCCLPGRRNGRPTSNSTLHTRQRCKATSKAARLQILRSLRHRGPKTSRLSTKQLAGGHPLTIQLLGGPARAQALDFSEPRGRHPDQDGACNLHLLQGYLRAASTSIPAFQGWRDAWLPPQGGYLGYRPRSMRVLVARTVQAEGP